MEKGDEKKTALEVPVQEQFKKTNEIHINATDFEKLIVLLKTVTKPIDLSKKFKIILSYDPKLPTVEVDYFKSE
ncbi:hypothetical protein DVV81_08330 [Clostridium botulinum]|uniref:hypothetical protein n=1 Tax=Clostridium botulinum TaxID=1491 RepID=UPI00196719A7|nr:hypothetical protein [Clostridium botulinum]MBN1071176.1 hypothetical protein [Clostridium botulinum]